MLSYDNDDLHAGPEEGKVKRVVVVGWDETIKMDDLCGLNGYSFT